MTQQNDHAATTALGRGPWRRAPRLCRALLAGALALSLAACAGPSRAPELATNLAPSRTSAPRTTPPAPQFSDAKPITNWGGRAPQAYAVHGVDVSRYQTEIDWPTARAHGVSFAFIKATEGGDRVDPMFQAHWTGAARAGVARGAYHFFYHCRPAAEQARWFIANVPKTAGALPPVLDMEWTPFSPTCTLRRPAAELRAEARTFISILERHYGQKPLLYTTIDFFEANEMWRLKEVDFWLRAVAKHPQDLYAGHHWALWQYTSTGLVPGIKGEVDLNVFAGNPRQWNAWRAGAL